MSENNDFVECHGCGEKVSLDEAIQVERGGRILYVCESCYEYDLDEPIALFTLFMPDGGRMKGIVGCYRYEVYEDFEADARPNRGAYSLAEDLAEFLLDNLEWIPTDPWRGYYDIKSSNENDKWVKVDSDCILAYSKDSEELKKHADNLIETLLNIGVAVAQVITRTSNLFSSGWDLYAYKPHMDQLKTLLIKYKVAEGRLKYRNSERFILTALTGKDPDQADECDRLFVRIAKRILSKPKEEVKRLTHDDLIEMINEEMRSINQ